MFCHININEEIIVILIDTMYILCLFQFTTTDISGHLKGQCVKYEHLVVGLQQAPFSNVTLFPSARKICMERKREERHRFVCLLLL